MFVTVKKIAIISLSEVNFSAQKFQNRLYELVKIKTESTRGESYLVEETWVECLNQSCHKYDCSRATLLTIKVSALSINEAYNEETA